MKKHTRPAVLAGLTAAALAAFIQVGQTPAGAESTTPSGQPTPSSSASTSTSPKPSPTGSATTAPTPTPSASTSASPTPEPTTSTPPDYAQTSVFLVDEEINLVTSADRSREYAVVALCDIRYGKPTVTSGALNIEPLVQYGTLKDFPNGALYVASATVKDSAPNGPGSVRLQCGETYNTVRFTVTGTASTTKPKPVDKDKAVKVAGGAGGSAEKPSGRIETGGGATARG